MLDHLIALAIILGAEGAAAHALSSFSRAWSSASSAEPMPPAAVTASAKWNALKPAEKLLHTYAAYEHEHKGRSFKIGAAVKRHGKCVLRVLFYKGARQERRAFSSNATYGLAWNDIDDAKTLEAALEFALTIYSTHRPSTKRKRGVGAGAKRSTPKTPISTTDRRSGNGGNITSQKKIKLQADAVAEAAATATAARCAARLARTANYDYWMDKYGQRIALLSASGQGEIKLQLQRFPTLSPLPTINSKEREEVCSKNNEIWICLLTLMLNPTVRRRRRICAVDASRRGTDFPIDSRQRLLVNEN